MIKIRVWAHEICPMEGEVKAVHINALQIAERTASLLAELYKGHTTSSFCGTVNMNDVVVVPSLTAEQEQLIKRAFPFVTIEKS